MNNYKIKVNNTHPKAYQEVLDIAAELGYANEDWGNLYNLNYLFLNEDGSVGFSLNGEAVSDEHQELTLPQLRDLVVLHRNDVKDATHTHKNFEKAKSIILSATNEVCDWIDDKWKVTCRQVSELKPIQPQPEQGLISGADAKLAWAKGEIIEYSYIGDWCEIDAKTEIGIFDRKDIALRIKPNTITLNLEIPAPFEPKQSDWDLIDIYYLDANQSDGWNADHFNEHFDDDLIQFGAWRTEEEIKQVVAALRGIKG